MMASTERLLSGVCWSGHNIWYTESLIAGKVAGARGGRGGCSLAPESERPPVTTVRAQLVGVHCLQSLGPGTEPSTAEDDSWQLSWPATSCHPSVSIIHTCISTRRRPQSPHMGGEKKYLQKISEENSVLFARMVGAITTWINPQDETLTACLAALSARLQGDPGPRWCLQPSKESGLETLIMQQVTGPEQSHHNMSQGINNMLEKFPTCLHI